MEVYTSAKKAIKSKDQVETWENSAGLENMLGFLQSVNLAVKGRMCTDPHKVSDNVKKAMEMLNTMDKWIDDIPPVEQPQRFGNQAFRTWMDRLNEESENILKAMLPENLHSAIVELKCYLEDAFGNKTRIDYGSGHELTYAAFLCCLTMIGFFEEDDMRAIGLTLFRRYLEVVRKLQTTYMLEPAGSHGVWGLDDYQFIPYYWGASQLIGGSGIKPSQIPDRAIAETYADDYLFFGCIRFIYKMKTGPFHEHSRYLFDISSVPEWTKVNSGLLKMYKAEVLFKFPVIQHFLFGNILTLLPRGSFSAIPSLARPDIEDVESDSKRNNNIAPAAANMGVMPHSSTTTNPSAAPAADSTSRPIYTGSAGSRPPPLRTEAPPATEDPFAPGPAAAGVPIAGPIAPGFDPRKARGTNGPSRGSLRPRPPRGE